MTEMLTAKQIKRLVRKYHNADRAVVLQINYDGGCIYIQPDWKNAADHLAREYANRATSIMPMEVKSNGKCE